MDEPESRLLAQPYRYPPALPWEEPDWRRLPGYRDVTADEWRSARWQRAHTVKNLRQLREALGHWLDDALVDDIARDMEVRGDDVDADPAADALDDAGRGPAQRSGAALHGACPL